MRKFLFCVITVVFLISTSSERVVVEPVLMDGLSGLALYETFLDDLQSGIVTRTDISFDSWYDFVSFTSEQICFAQNERGYQELTYRVREPLVFWYYPEPSYFDGKNYYYKHNDNWFVDTHNRFREYLRRDFMGIPTEVLTACPVSSDRVYRLGGAYKSTVVLEAADGSLRYTIDASLDADLLFEQIHITAQQSTADGKNDYRHFYNIRYDKVNEPLVITPPASFDRGKLIG